MKLIFTTSLLLLAAVGTAGYSSLHSIQVLTESEVDARRTEGEAAIRRDAEIMARIDANSAALPLSEGNSTYLDALVIDTIKADPRVRWMLIADAGGRVEARTPGAPTGEQLGDRLNDEVMKAPAGQVAILRDPDDQTRFTVGIRAEVNGRVVGQLRLGISTLELEESLGHSIDDAREQSRIATRGMILIAGIILLAGILIGALQGLRMARPLNALSLQAHRIAEGDLEQRVEISGGDEIGRLGQDFNFMADRLRQMIAESANKASLEREMTLARTVQESMIPARTLIEHGSFRVVGTCEPATTCGGDWWTLRKLTGDRVLLAVGDVTGHGIPSAMVAANARGAVEALAKVDERLLTPEQVLHAIDSAIRGVGENQLLMTCFVALIDARRGVIEFSNAGHNFPYLLHVENGQVTDLAVLALRGSPLGNVAAEPEVKSGQKQLSPGDLFVFYTDGVIDRVDVQGNRFGDRRLRGMLTKRSFPGTGEGLTSLRDEILRNMKEFAGEAPADDDVTLVLCQYDPRAQAQQNPRQVA